MGYKYEPDAVRVVRQRKRQELGAVYEEYKARARACLLWDMDPNYYDSMPDVEYLAWIEAWNEIQEEQERSLKS